MQRPLMLLAMLTLLTGCATIDLDGTCNGKNCESAIISKTVEKDDKVTQGVLYSLPRQRVKIAIKGEHVTSAGLDTKIAALTTKIGDLTTSIKTLNDNKKDAEAQRTALGDQNAEVTGKLTVKIFEFDAQIKVATDKVAALNKQVTEFKKKKGALPPSGKTFEVTVTPTAETPYADGEAMLSAVMVDNLATADSFEIKTTDGGLLSGGTGTSKGQVDEIIVSLAQAIGVFQAKSFEPQLTAKMSRDIDGSISAACENKPFSQTFILDFQQANRAEAQINQYFSSEKLCLKFDIANKNTFATDFELLTYNPAGTDNSLYDGLVYPRKSPLRMSLCETDTPGATCSILPKTPPKYFSVDVIDPTRLGVIELEQGVFADNTYEFDFSNGLLTRYKSDKPSEIVSMLAMIPAAAKALVEIPAELIQLKFDLSDKDRAYYEMQTAILKAQIENDVLTKNKELYEASLLEALLAPADDGSADDTSADAGL